MLKAQWLGTRWLGVGLASVLAVVTLSLAITGRLGLYINPDSTWFAVSMAVLVLVGAVASFALPLGAEAEHGHDHGDGHGHGHGHGHEHEHEGAGVSSRSAVPEGRGTSRLEGRSTTGSEDRSATGVASVVERARHERDETPPRADHHARHPAAIVATVTGGVVASGVVVLALVLPPASLSAELAMSRDVGATPLFGGADTIQLASTGDTGSFGVGEWATAFATATNPDAFDGDTVELTGFVTPGEDGEFDLTRLVITHCVIDAQPASLPIAAEDVPDTGQWVTVTGTVRSTSDGRLVVDATTVEPIPEPEDPYEY